MTFDKLIFDTLRANGMPVELANLMTAQAGHETGGYTSNLFKSCSNAFGYKYAGQAIATKGIQSPEGDYYAKYATVADSAKELAAWIKRRVNEGKFPANLASIKTAEQYAALLKNAGYFGAPLSEYTAGLKRFFKEHSTGTGTAAIMLACVGLYFLLSK